MVQAVANYETSDNKRAFVRAVFTGLADLEAGRELSLAKPKRNSAPAERLPIALTGPNLEWSQRFALGTRAGNEDILSSRRAGSPPSQVVPCKS